MDVIRALALVAAFVAVVVPLQTETTELPLPDGTRLAFEHPASWRASVAADQKPGPKLHLVVKEPIDADIQITVLGRAKSGRMSDADLEKAVRERGAGVLPQSQETELTLARLAGKQIKGFVYHLTDRNPEQGPGDWRHLDEGMAMVGPVLIAFTVLTHPADHSTVKDALKMLSGVTLRGGH